MPRNTHSRMFFYYVYVLKSLKDGCYYTGYTNDLRKRLEEHNAGKSFATNPRKPFKLLYYEACLNQDDAKQREKYLKTTTGRRFISKRLKHYLDLTR